MGQRSLFLLPRPVTFWRLFSALKERNPAQSIFYAQLAYIHCPCLIHVYFHIAPGLRGKQIFCFPAKSVFPVLPLNIRPPSSHTKENWFDRKKFDTILHSNLKKTRISFLNSGFFNNRKYYRIKPFEILCNFRGHNAHYKFLLIFKPTQSTPPV